MTKFGRITHVGEGRIYRESDTPRRKEQGLSAPEFGDSLLFMLTTFDTERSISTW